jgi:hypothetical protein
VETEGELSRCGMSNADHDFEATIALHVATIEECVGLRYRRKFMGYLAGVYNKIPIVLQ